jgi:predicted HTH transcriptional regulator
VGPGQLRKEVVDQSFGSHPFTQDKSAVKGGIGDKSAIKGGGISDKTAIKCDSCNKESSSVEQKLCIIIEYMQTHRIVTVADIAQLLSIKSSRSRDYLRILVDRGVLATNGANKNRTYILKNNIII